MSNKNSYFKLQMLNHFIKKVIYYLLVYWVHMVRWWSCSYGGVFNSKRLFLCFCDIFLRG